jgi:hypothetical protein
MNAFEKNYGCLNLTCEEIGGLYDIDLESYFPGAEPCNYRNSSSTAIFGLFGIFPSNFCLQVWCFNL